MSLALGLVRYFLSLTTGGTPDPKAPDGGNAELRLAQDGALWTRPAAPSVTPFAWTVSGAGSCAPPAWTAGEDVSVGKVRRTAAGLYVRYLGSGTTAADGAGPTLPGSQVDNGVPCFVVPSFTGGLSFAQSNSTPSIGSEGATLFPVPTIGTPTPLPLGDPALVFTSAAVVVLAYP